MALGSTTNFYGLPGLEQHALTMKTLGDAIHLRNEVIGALEEADGECAAGGDEPLTFVVVGGGFAGVETIAGLNDFVREGLAFYPRVTASRVRMVLVHAGSVILPELGEKLGRYAQQQLARGGVEIITNAKVADAGRDGVRLADGRFIPSRLIVWTAGTSPHPLLHDLPCQLDHGRIVVDETLACQASRACGRVGDCAVVPDRRTGKPHPPTAQHAIREGKTVARNIAASIKGRPPVPFDFRTIGQLAAIGKRTGVARVAGVNFSGFFAWWLWRTVYLSKLPRLEKKIRVAIDWTLDLVFSKDFVQFLTVRAPVMSTARLRHSARTRGADGRIDARSESLVPRWHSHADRRQNRMARGRRPRRLRVRHDVRDSHAALSRLAVARHDTTHRARSCSSMASTSGWIRRPARSPSPVSAMRLGSFTRMGRAGSCRSAAIRGRRGSSRSTTARASGTRSWSRTAADLPC